MTITVFSPFNKRLRGCGLTLEESTTSYNHRIEAKKLTIKYCMTCVFLLPLRIFWRTASPFPRFVDRNNHDFFPVVLQLSVIPFSPASFSPHQPHLTPGC